MDAGSVKPGGLSQGVQVTCPNGDLEVRWNPKGGWSFTRKDGTPS